MFYIVVPHSPNQFISKQTIISAFSFLDNAVLFTELTDAQQSTKRMKSGRYIIVEVRPKQPFSLKSTFFYAMPPVLGFELTGLYWHVAPQKSASTTHGTKPDPQRKETVEKFMSSFRRPSDPQRTSLDRFLDMKPLPEDNDNHDKKISATRKHLLKPLIASGNTGKKATRQPFDYSQLPDLLELPLDEVPKRPAIQTKPVNKPSEAPEKPEKSPYSCLSF